MREDVFQNRNRPLKDVVVPVAKDTKTFIRQYSVTPPITLRVAVLAAVDFDDNLSTKTDEVQNVVLKWRLPAKFDPRESAITQ
jgi:hypothetical protein